ncbi:MAG: hypothetical protein ACREMO_11810 [Gemmatimonadales bacterium]
MTPTTDRLSRFFLAVIALALVWIAARPHVHPAPAEAGREAIIVDIERVAGRFLTRGAIPIRCGDLRP